MSTEIAMSQDTMGLCSSYCFPLKTGLFTIYRNNKTRKQDKLETQVASEDTFRSYILIALKRCF